MPLRPHLSAGCAAGAQLCRVVVAPRRGRAAAVTPRRAAESVQPSRAAAMAAATLSCCSRGSSRNQPLLSVPEPPGIPLQPRGSVGCAAAVLTAGRVSGKYSEKISPTTCRAFAASSPGPPRVRARMPGAGMLPLRERTEVRCVAQDEVLASQENSTAALRTSTAGATVESAHPPEPAVAGRHSSAGQWLRRPPMWTIPCDRRVAAGCPSASGRLPLAVVLPVWRDGRRRALGVGQ